MPVVRARSLTKRYAVHEREPGMAAALRSVFRRRYRTVTAVEDVSFEVAAGERVGFLGPNGAGKTTTLKMLCGLLHPTSGEAYVGGHVPKAREDDFLRKITFVTGQRQQLLWDLPPSETFELNRALYEVPARQYAETVAELTELLDLGELVKKPTRQLSLGERMKCELAAALIHRPSVLFLDEPTLGLDVSMQATLRAFIKAYNERWGAALMLTSHYMDDVAALCPRVIVIDKGRVSYDGTLEDLTRRMRPEKRVALRLERPVTPESVARVVGDAGALVVEHSDPQLVMQVRFESVNAVVSRALSALPVKDLAIEDPPLEEVMSELFAQSRKDREARG